MVLVDTSVWIRFLQGRLPYAQHLDDLLDQEEVAAHDVVYGELLMGDIGGRAALLNDYSHLTWVPSVAHSEIVTFVRERRLHGRGIGWMDAHLLGSALVSQVRLWTADERLAAIAGEIGARYALA